MRTEYDLVKFTGDSSLNEHCSAIISWSYTGKGQVSHSDVIKNVKSIKLPGILKVSSCYDKNMKRHTIVLDVADGNIIVTVDTAQQRMSLITDGKNIRMLHDIVDCILYSKYNCIIKYYIEKILQFMRGIRRKRYNV